MKSAAAGTVSGCIVWVILLGVLATCLFPVAFTVGMLTTQSDLAVKTTAPYVCPKETTPHINSYEGTTTDDNGFETPATIYELQCLDANGKVVYTDPIVWGFIWLGIAMAIAVVVTGVLALLLAAPAGVLIGRFFGGTKATPA